MNADNSKVVFEATHGIVDEILDKTIEKLFCVYVRSDNNTIEACEFLLKLCEHQYWYEFYLEFGFCKWIRYEKYPDDFFLEDLESDMKVDLSDRNGVTGLKIEKASVQQISKGVSLELHLSDKTHFKLENEYFEKEDDIGEQTKLNIYNSDA